MNLQIFIYVAEVVDVNVGQNVSSSKTVKVTAYNSTLTVPELRDISYESCLIDVA